MFELLDIRVAAATTRAVPQDWRPSAAVPAVGIVAAAAGEAGTKGRRQAAEEAVVSDLFIMGVVVAAAMLVRQD